jgi:hypothetical protein
MLLDELSHQMMKISDLLVGSRERVIDHKMNLGRVPDPRYTHLTEHFDRKRPSAVLSHREINWKYSNVSRAIGLLGTIGSDANDLLRKGQRIIVQDILTQLSSGSGEKTGRY